MPEEKVIERPEYTEEELVDRSRDMTMMRRARDKRESSHPQFDDMGYTEWYKANDRASYTYNPPKQNESDKRIRTGITNDKVITLVSHFMNFNFKADIEAYDDTGSDVVFVNNNRLGNHIEDMVKKQEEIENFEEVLGQIYAEGITQGDAICAVIDEPERMIKKKLSKTDWRDGETIKMEDLKFTEESQYKNYRKVITKMYSGLNVIPGDIYEQSIANQPFMVVRETTSYDKAMSAWGAFERFKYVPKNLEEFQGSEAEDWLIGDYRENYVEVLMIQEKGSNRVQVYLNGVSMFPVGFPLSALMGVCDYTIEKLSIEPRYGFFYSKGQVAKIRVNHALFDIFLRSFVQKTEQSVKPPLGNTSDTQYGLEVFEAGKITPDISKDELFPLIDTPGVTQSEMAMLDLIKRIVDQDSVDNIFEGQSQKGNQTLGEIQRLEANTAKKLGYAMLGITQFHKRLAWKKVYMILNSWTQPIDTRIDPITEEIKNVYRKVNVSTEYQGMQTEKVINFVEGAIPQPEQEDAMSNIMSNARGRRVRVAHLNAEELRNLNYMFYIVVSPTQKQSSELKAARFEESLMKALQIFPPLGKQLNIDHISDRWAQHNSEDPEKYFAEEQTEEGTIQALMGQKGGDPISTQMQPKQPQQPSLNTLVNQS